MRRSELDRGFEGAGRPVGRLASLPSLRFAGRAGDDAPFTAVADRRSVMLSRRIAGLPCLIRVAASAFHGIAAVEAETGYRVRMLHRDPGLTLDVGDGADREEAIAVRDRIAADLNLPVVILAPDGSFETQLLRPASWAATPEGRRTRLRPRPRFLARRRVGGAPLAPPMSGREIIARP